MSRQQINAARKTRSLQARLASQSKDTEEYRQHIGKIGEQSLGESWTVKGWVGEGYLWQGIIPHPTGENFDSLEAAITAALGTDDWGLQNGLGLWAVAKKAAKARAAATR